jgi:dCMP deaminase
MDDPRMSKEENYLLIAHDLALRSPCTRRKFGAVIVLDGCIISTGYNGSARGTTNCGIECPCLKDINNEESIKSYDHCPAIHAEMNSIINAARRGVSVAGATMYLDVIFRTVSKRERPCFLCRRFMIQAGIKDIYFYDMGHKIVHEYVADYVKMEDDWIAAQQKIAQ